MSRPKPSPPQYPDWDLAKKPRAEKSALIIDGFDSDSSEKHLVYEYLENAQLPVEVAAFSYSGIGRGYPPQDTHHLITAAPLLADYLPKSRTRAVIPVGSSGGAVIAILGVAHWISAHTIDAVSLSLCVPRIILVAPPFKVHEDNFIEQFVANRSPQKSIPSSVMSLVKGWSPENLAMRKMLAEALGLIKWSGIDVCVVRWQHDALTLSSWDDDIKRAVYSAVRKKKNRPQLNPRNAVLPRDARRALIGHLQFLRHPKTLQHVQRWITESTTIN